MDLQATAFEVSDALVALGLSTMVSSSAEGYACQVREQSSAVLYFTVDQFRGLVVTVSYDGGPAVGLDYSPTSGNAVVLAKHVADEIARQGQGR